MITKSHFLSTISCNAQGWLSYHVPSTLSVDEQYRIEEGLEVGSLSRSVYDGILVEGKNFNDAVRKTKELLASQNEITLFEAAFQHDIFGTKADILLKTKEGVCDLIEVKSSINAKSEFIDDMAYTAMVIMQAGIKLGKISLLLLSKNYRKGGPLDKLFVSPIDYTDKVLERAELFLSYCESVKNIICKAACPSIALDIKCRKCSHLNNDCELFNSNTHIFDLPRLSKTKFNALLELGIDNIQEIPNDFTLTPQQDKVYQSVLRNDCIVEEGLYEVLCDIKWPVFYLDFETMQTAIPKIDRVAPFAQVPTQFSIHKCDKVGVISNHCEYLSKHDKDYRETLIKELIKGLEEAGSIIVYTSFEERIINSLIDDFPQYGEPLKSLIERMVDLERIIRNYFYHPSFHGSTSIKKVLPALVPDMTYYNLEINNGSLAVVQFVKMVKGCSDDEREQIREALLEYCCQDTLAMVKLHEQLLKYAVQSKNSKAGGINHE